MRRREEAIEEPAIRSYRERAGLSREQLVRRLPFMLTGNSLWRIETGQNRTDVETALALAQALSEALDEEITVEALFRRDEPPRASHKASKQRAGSATGKPGSMRNRQTRIEFIGRTSTAQSAA